MRFQVSKSKCHDNNWIVGYERHENDFNAYVKGDLPSFQAAHEYIDRLIKGVSACRCWWTEGELHAGHCCFENGDGECHEQEGEALQKAVTGRGELLCECGDYRDDWCDIQEATKRHIAVCGKDIHAIGSGIRWTV